MANLSCVARNCRPVSQSAGSRISRNDCSPTSEVLSQSFSPLQNAAVKVGSNSSQIEAMTPIRSLQPSQNKQKNSLCVDIKTLQSILQHRSSTEGGISNLSGKRHTLHRTVPPMITGQCQDEKEGESLVFTAATKETSPLVGCSSSVTASDAVDVINMKVKTPITKSCQRSALETILLSQINAFDSFSVLSIHKNEANLRNKTFTQDGSRFLDPFVCKTADVLEVHPAPVDYDKNTYQSILTEFTTVCSSVGVKARLIPKVAIERATALGWVGNKTDSTQFISFFDPSGKKKSGLLITFTEETRSVELVEKLSQRRIWRRAAVVLVRWWRKAKQNTTLLKRKRKKEESAAEGEEVKNATKHHKSLVPQNERKSSHCKKSLGNKSKLPSSFGEFRHKIAKHPFHLCSSTAQKREREDHCSHGNAAVTAAIKRFIDTSPLQMFDPEKETGIWVSAKLKKCSVTEALYIAVRIAPSNWEQNEPNQRNGRKVVLEDERQRLITMVKGIRLDRTPDNFPEVTKVVFKECKRLKKGNADEASLKPILKPSMKPSLKPSTPKLALCRKRTLAIESHQEMLKAAKLRDVCVVEKCYIFVGGQKQTRSLLKRIQQVAKKEREHNFIVREKDFHSISRVAENPPGLGQDIPVVAEQKIVFDSGKANLFQERGTEQSVLGDGHKSEQSVLCDENKPERSKPERSQPEQSKPEQSEPEQSEPQQSEQEHSFAKQSVVVTYSTSNSANPATPAVEAEVCHPEFLRQDLRLMLMLLLLVLLVLPMLLLFAVVLSSSLLFFGLNS